MTPSESRQELVYFIRCGKRGPVKIGKTTGHTIQDAMYRLEQLQCGNPEKLYLLGITPGGLKRERELHERLKAHRLRGEWFKPTQELMDVLRSVADYAPDQWRGQREYGTHCTNAVRCTNCGFLFGQDHLVRVEPRMCSACEEFAALRASGEDPFADLDTPKAQSRAGESCPSDLEHLPLAS